MVDNTVVDVNRLDQIDTKTLLAMFVQVQKQNAENQKALAEAQKQLGEAILESRKPYVSPADAAAKKQQYEDRRAAIEKELKTRADRKLYCPHIHEDGRYNIKWMEHSNHVIKGVCGNCFAEFDARDKADRLLLQHDPKSIKNMGRAGSHANSGYIG